MLYCLSIGSCDLLDVCSLLLQISKSPALSGVGPDRKPSDKGTRTAHGEQSHRAER